MKIKLGSVALLALLSGSAEAQVFVPGSGGGGGGSVTQGTTPWVDNVTQWASTALAVPTAWGSAPSGIVIGANVNCVTGCSSTGGSSQTDEATFTPGTTAFTAIGGLYQTSITALTTGQAGAMALTSDRNVFVNLNKLAGTALGAPSAYGTSPGAVNVPGVNASVTASVLPTGAATSANQPTNAAQGSTTSGQTGNLGQGAVTTAAPTYTAGQTDPLSLDTAGNLRTNCVTGCNSPIAAGTNYIGTIGVVHNDTAPSTINVTAQDTASTTTASNNSQNLITGTPTTNSAASFALASGFDTARVQVTGTWTGTLNLEESSDGGTVWTPIGAHQNGTNYSPNTFTGNFAATAQIAGTTNIRVRSTAAWTGTATVRIVQTVNPGAIDVSNPGSFGGSSLGSTAPTYASYGSGLARSSEPTASTTNTTVAAMRDLIGREIVFPFANKENLTEGSNTAVATTPGGSLLASAGSGLYNYITSLSCFNSGSTGSTIVLTNGSGGTAFWTGYAAASGGGFTLSFPSPLGGEALSTATAVFVYAGSSSTTIYCNAAGFKGT